MQSIHVVQTEERKCPNRLIAYSRVFYYPNLIRYAPILVVLTEEDDKIGQYIAQELVEDGATLQMGIGAIPDAVSAFLLRVLDLNCELLVEFVGGLRIFMMTVTSLFGQRPLLTICKT